MKKLNKKGFTLIELLAVITIMGILMIVAIPAISRTIENSRRDTFLDTAKQYANSVKTLWAADGLTCGTDTLPSAAGTGYYYVSIDSSNTSLLESGGKSAWGNKDVTGYVLVNVDANGKTKYYVALADAAGHGIAAPATTNPTEYLNLKRANVAVSGVTQQSVATPNSALSASPCTVS